MIDFTKLTIGDKLFYVRETTNICRPLITKIDDNGVEWRRHDKPIRNYDIVNCTLVGTLIRTETGNCGDNRWNSDEYYIENNIGTLYTEFVYQNEFSEQYSLTYEEAVAYVKECLEKDRNI